ncbi:M15 family metallopeptidase [Gilvimarinus xylanilyticus]|uniref:M15 family metallopeptidase n=1 Tax=Gilvimarinus xylanilyticus TaxID=2944139 RepID=A0A9X2KTG9_9GAMM|nr:M15 family metallopeptidase [Gilvimarinus xylanilyticus]MCP8899234.1 M15 family metallopeptidase [Gilvimarinus xylanilyticus]
MSEDPPVTERQALGLDDAHLVTLAGSVKLHPQTLTAFTRLREACVRTGCDLAVASGYRSFDRQLAIFNAKARGERAVLDDRGCKVDMQALSQREQLFAILRYSALPGASRHHWGTDMDVFDPAAMPEDYRLQLTPAECVPEGVFGRLHAQLDIDLPDTEFYRPYQFDYGAIAPEPWHLSYRPLARRYAQVLTRDLLGDCLSKTDIALKAVVLNYLDDIYRQYVLLEPAHVVR